MYTSQIDLAVIIFLEATLVIAFGYYFIKDILSALPTKKATGSGLIVKDSMHSSVKRGENSMAYIYWVYGTVTIVLSIAVDVASGIDGFKTLLIIVNYCLLSYLFLLNKTFRNRRLMLIKKIIESD